MKTILGAQPPTPTLFDPRPPDPKNDAAPLPGGANVSGLNSHPKSNTASLPLLPPARRNAPVGTSQTAAARIAGGAARLRDRVLDHIAAQGDHGATDAETQAALGMLTQTQTPRRRELVQLRLVRDSGQRRPTPSGRPAAVWVAVKPDGAEGGHP